MKFNSWVMYFSNKKKSTTLGDTTNVKKNILVAILPSCVYVYLVKREFFKIGELIYIAKKSLVTMRCLLK